MSTIAARAHSGVSLSAPAVRRAAPPARRKVGWLGRVGRLALRRPGRALIFLLFTGVATVILANALLLQQARHPAPMVSAPSASPAPRQASRSEIPAAPVPSQPAAAPASGVAAPIPPTRPADLSPSPREAGARPPAAVTNVARTAPAPAPAARASAPAQRDPIADLINGADIRPPAEVRGVAQARSSNQRRSAEN
ncbi:MAG: hypothetical protein Q8S58_21195 [Bosea sp. (in: a-proteobacteria)]|nr:hypothetical protein [Bosea sp. (in: a-proteobacteria)]